MEIPANRRSNSLLNEESPHMRTNDDQISPHSSNYQTARIFGQRSQSLFRSTKTLKQESRAAVLAAFREHREKRLAVKRREENERRRIMNVWKHEERLARERQLFEMFSRLSQSKAKIEEEKLQEHLSQIQEKVERSRQKVQEFRNSVCSKRSSVSHRERLETVYKKREQILSEERDRKLLYSEQKKEKADLVLMRLKEFHNQTVQLNKERREKKTLRSKVQSLLTKEGGFKCDRHDKNVARITAAINKDEVAHAKVEPIKKILQRKLDSCKSQPLLGKLQPDEVLLQYFDAEELRHVFLLAF